MLAVESGELATRSAKSHRVTRIAETIKAYACADEETSERLITSVMAFWHTNGFSQLASPTVMTTGREPGHSSFITASFSRPLVEMPLPP